MMTQNLTSSRLQLAEVQPVEAVPIKLHSLYFEGVRLPDFGVLFDTATVLTSVSPETEAWFWRFCLCVDTPRRERADVVLRHVRELLSALQATGDAIQPDLEEKFPTAKAEQIMADWIKSLQIMMELSSVRKFCQWHMQPAAEE